MHKKAGTSTTCPSKIIRCMGRFGKNTMSFSFNTKRGVHEKYIRVTPRNRVNACLGIIRDIEGDIVTASLFMPKGEVIETFDILQISGNPKQNDVFHYRSRPLGDGRTSVNREVVELPVKATKSNLRRFSQLVRVLMGNLTGAEIVS